MCVRKGRRGKRQRGCFICSTFVLFITPPAGERGSLHQLVGGIQRYGRIGRETPARSCKFLHITDSYYCPCEMSLAESTFSVSYGQAANIHVMFSSLFLFELSHNKSQLLYAPTEKNNTDYQCRYFDIHKFLFRAIVKFKYHQKKCQNNGRNI